MWTVSLARRDTHPIRRVLRKCQSVRWSADMAGTPSASTSSAVVPVTLPRRRAHSANGRATDTTAYRCSTVCIFSQLARRSTALPSPLASARYSHRAGCAMASSVTIRPRESLRFVTEAHRHLSPVREAGCASQPQRRRTALAESHQMKACALQ